MFNCRKLFPNWFFLFSSLFLFTIVENAFAISVDDKMQQAGEYYRNGEFDNAIKIYEELRNEGYDGTSLYFNMANSYYRIGKLG